MTLPASPMSEVPTAFTHSPRLSLPESIADSIAEAIATGHLRPGERIVELTLASRLAVSRVPIREALKVLNAHGIVTGANHRGYRVAETGPATTAKVFETRLALEGFLLRDAIVNWRNGDEHLNELDAAIRSMEIAAKLRDKLASLKADLDFHRTIRRAARNEIAGILWDAIARHVLIIFNQQGYRDKDLNAVVRQHRSFRNQIATFVEIPPDDDGIRKALEDHFFLVARRYDGAADVVKHALPKPAPGKMRRRPRGPLIRVGA